MIVPPTNNVPMAARASSACTCPEQPQSRQYNVQKPLNKGPRTLWDQNFCLLYREVVKVLLL